MRRLVKALAAALCWMMLQSTPSAMTEQRDPNLYLYQFGTKRQIPRNFGKSIKIPRLKKQNIVSPVTEGTIIGTCPISGQFISGTLVAFAGAYKHSDFVIMTALSDVIELSLRDLARDIAKRIDTYIRDQISGVGVSVNGTSGALPSQQVGTGDILKAKAIINAAAQLDAVDNPRPPDGHYPVVIHPKVVFDLQQDTAAGGWLDVNKYATDNTVGLIYRGEIGRLYGARFVTSTNVKRLVSGLSTGISGWRGFMFAPDAYYVTEISELTARTFVKQLGSGGTADPVNQIATVGAKVYLACVPATWTATEYRIVRLMHTSTL